MNVWKVQRIFTLIFLSLLTPNRIEPILPPELVKIALALLDPIVTPGLDPILKKATKDQGAAFELEAALTIITPDNPIIGFDLDLNFRNKHALVLIKREFIEVKTTEFDIITPKLAIECKSYKHPSKCDLEQIIKEKTMLAWARELAHEIKEDQVDFSFEKAKTGTPFVSIKSKNPFGSTCGESIPITSSWFTSDEEESCKSQLKNIIELLSHLSLRVFFKNEASDALRARLGEENVIITDDIRLRKSSLKGRYDFTVE